MKKIFTCILCLVMTVSLLSGCQNKQDTSTIRVAISGDTSVLDPAIVDDNISANVLNQMYDGLYRFNANGNLVAKLAVGQPTVSKDGLTYTIKIKKKAKWSDGSKVKASDFVYAWKRAAAMGKSKSYYSQYIIDYIDGAIDGDKDENAFENMKDTFGVTAVDDYTIRIRLKEKCSYFKSLLVNNVFYPVKQSCVGENPLSSEWASSTDMITNGAFIPSMIDTSSEIDLVKNNNYYKKDKVVIENIQFKVISDSEEQIEAFENNEIDFATGVDPATVYGDEDLISHVFLIDPYVSNYFILLNCGDENDESTEGLKALKDVEIREALALAIDRDSCVDATGYGDAAKALYGLVPSGILGANENFRDEAGDVAPAYDIDAAKEIMESKGYSKDNMLHIVYKYNASTMNKEVAKVIQKSAKKAYFDIELVELSGKELSTQRDEGHFEICREAMSADFMDPMAYLSMFVGDIDGNTVDDSKYENMVKSGNGLASQVKRMEALEKAERYLVGEKYYIIPLFSYVNPILRVDGLVNIASSPDGHYGLTRAYYQE